MQPMRTGSNLWVLSPTVPGDPNSLPQQAAQRCRDRLCEACVAILAEAIQAEPNNYAMYFQLGLCCGGSCRDHSQTSPEIALTYLRLALALVSPSGEPKERAQILSAMGNTWLISDHEPLATRLQAAISCFKEAAQTHLGVGDMEAWARDEFNLGNSYCELPEESSPGKWEEAVSHYQRALQIRTMERDPICYAATQENLGTAYRELPCGDKTANVWRAIQCYRQALQVYTLALFPQKYAAANNNLGNAFASLPCSNTSSVQRNKRRALRHYERALRLRTRASFPRDYAVTQFNRGMAFLRLAREEREPQLSLRSAQICFAEAADCFAGCGQEGRAQAAREQANVVGSLLPNENPDRFRHSR